MKKILKHKPFCLKGLKIYLSFILILFSLIILLPKHCPSQIPLLIPQVYQWVRLPRFIPNQVIIFFEPGINIVQILALYTFYGLKEISVSPISGARLVLIPPLLNLQETIVRLNMEAIVLFAEPNYIGQVSFIPNDPYYKYQWHLRLINLENAWNLSTGLGVCVAVLDTGVAFENFDIFALAPDLSGTKFVPGWDFVNNDANPDDDNGHGTHITGTIAQTTNNLYGCAGVAFNATIMPVKVMDNNGNGGLTDIVDGIYFAVNNGAKVINMSFGFGNNPTLTLETAIDYAYNNGVSMVCSAGNNSTDVPNYPASYPVCISVSGVRYDLTLGDYSNFGPDIDICAPGGDITIDQNLDGFPDGILQQSHDGTNFTIFNFLLGRGTSWAAAHVTGTIALMQSLGGGILTPLEIDQILKQTAIDLGAPGWDQYYGYGLVDAYAALLATIQASIATAEALFYSNLPLIPSTVLVPPLSQNLNNQAQSSINPIATINGEILNWGSVSLPFPQLQLTTNPFYFSLPAMLYQPLWTLPGFNYPYLNLKAFPNLNSKAFPFRSLTNLWHFPLNKTGSIYEFYFPL